MSEWARTLITVVVSTLISLTATFFTSMYLEPMRVRRSKQEDARQLRRSLYIQLAIICRAMTAALLSVQNSGIYAPAAIMIKSADMSRFESAQRNFDLFDRLREAGSLQDMLSTFREMRSYDLSDSALAEGALRQMHLVRKAIDGNFLDRNMCEEVGILRCLEQCPDGPV